MPYCPPQTTAQVHLQFPQAQQTVNPFTGLLFPAIPGLTCPGELQDKVAVAADQQTGLSFEELCLMQASGKFVLTGGAGSGISTLLAAIAAAKIFSGTSPQDVLVLTANSRGTTVVRDLLDQALVTISYQAAASPVRTVHSQAFAVVRAATTSGGGAMPRLLSGAEHDLIVRELLQEEAQKGAAQSTWPEEVHGALGMVGFARQLRDFMLRAVEMSLTGADLITLGEKYQRPLWSAAGKFLQEFRQIMNLDGEVRQLFAAEILNLALNFLDPAHPLAEKLLQEFSPKVLLVDDVQHFDPVSLRFVAALAARAQLVVYAGDPNQSIYKFRGADPESIADLPRDCTIELTGSFRQPAFAAYSVDHPSTLTGALADQLRRAHLIDGVAWEEMAVVVRAAGSLPPLRRALMAAGVPVTEAGGTTVLAENDLVAAILTVVALSDPEVQQRQITADALTRLICSPLAGATPLRLRRLLRSIRKVSRTLGETAPALQIVAKLLEVELVDVRHSIGTTNPIAPAARLARLEEQDPDSAVLIRKLQAVLAAGRQARRDKVSVEQTLWEIWDTTGLATKWQNAALQGGVPGAYADQQLDAMMHLFDVAGDYSERYPHQDVAAFAAHVTSLELETGMRDRGTGAVAQVALLTAHSTTSLEWRRVFVLDLQQGTWPDLVIPGTLFDQQELVDLIQHDITPGTPVSHLQERYQEERRLLHVALSRAKEQAVLFAINDPHGDEVFEPSPLLAQAASTYGFSVQQGYEPAAAAVGQPAVAGAESQLEPQDLTELAGWLAAMPGSRLISAENHVATLRRAVCATELPLPVRQQAARQLARMMKAAADLPTMPFMVDPGDWAGVLPPTPTVRLATQPVLSPSNIAALEGCMFHALYRNLAETHDYGARARGTLIHALAEAWTNLGDQAPNWRELLLTAAKATAAKIDQDQPQYLAAQLTADLVAGMNNTLQFLEQHAGIAAAAEAKMERIWAKHVASPVQIHGRIDRLEQTETGELAIYDFKTGKNAKSKQKVAADKQLLLYQYAVINAQLNQEAVSKAGLKTWELLEKPRSAPAPKTAGASLVYPLAGKTFKQVTQPPLAEETIVQMDQALADLSDQLDEALASGKIPVAISTGDLCSRCELINICPLHGRGESILATPQQS